MQNQSDISITIRRSYGKFDQQKLSLASESSRLSNLSFEVEFPHEDLTKTFNLMKSFILLLLISRLPLEAIEEAVQTLEQIKEFYADSSPENVESTITRKVVMGEIVSTGTRPPLVLAWD